MSSERSDASNRAAELRASFDAAFARGLEPVPVQQLDLIAVRVAGHAYALHVAGIAAVHAELRVAKLPSTCAALLGIASLRAGFAPVYDLARLLGYTQAGPPRWFVLTAGTPAAILAFEGYDGYLRVTPEAFSVVQGATTTENAAHVRERVSQEARTLPVIDLVSLMAAIAALVAQHEASFTAARSER